MSSRERRQKRENWKKNSQTYRDKIVKVRKNLARLLDETPPPSSEPMQNNDVLRNLAVNRRKQQLRRRRGILYAKISRLQERLKEEIRRKERYRKRCQRRNKNNQTSPEPKVSALLKNVRVPKIVKKKLLLSEVITKQLKNRYSNLKKHSEKKKYYEIVKPNLLKKHKLPSLSKQFFKHDCYKKSAARKVSAKLLRVKKDVQDFLEKDESSRMCPGKKDFVKSKEQVSKEMWSLFIAVWFLTLVLSKQIALQQNSNAQSVFRKEQIIFASDFNITKILVPADGNKYIMAESSEIPTIFFTVSDPKLEGGSCIYVLEGFAAYEILEGGRDSTADYSSDNIIYFGTKDGIYKYYPDSLSARKYGPFRDDIIQLQKANGSDTIFILNAEHKIYKIEKNGMVKTKIQSITCALEFVLDTSNNIYYLGCEDNMPHIVKENGNVLSLTASVIEDFKEIKLLRPAFIMEACIPFFGDGDLYILYFNGTCEKKEFFIKEKPSAFSVDAALYLVAALDGEIYEFNVMEVLLKSMFGVTDGWPRDITKIVMSVIGNTKKGIYGFYNDLNF